MTSEHLHEEFFTLLRQTKRLSISIWIKIDG